jgi:hypothetical protein
MAATQLLANYLDGYFQQQGMYRQMWSDKKWKGYIEDHVAKSPLLRRYVMANRDWFSAEFVRCASKFNNGTQEFRFTIDQPKSSITIFTNTSGGLDEIGRQLCLVRSRPRSQ